MSAYKRISGSYTIASVDPSAGDNVNIITHTVNITGNLDVAGNVTYIDVNELTVDDPFITVAANNSGTIATATFPQQGLVTQTSSNTFAGIRFDNGNLAWQVSSNVDANGAPITAYANLVIGNMVTPGGSNTYVQFNDGGTFGGNAALTFDKVTGKLTLQGHMALGNIGSTPIAVANSVVIYNKEAGAGGTGIYAVSSSVDDELVSKTKAMVFALIL